MGFEDVLRSLKVKNNLYVGGTIRGNVLNVPGDVWYVDILNGSASGSGKTWDDAFSTLALALAAAGNYDVIMIAQNAIATVTGMTITQTGLKIIGSNMHPGVQSHAMKQVAGTLPMFLIKADRVEIANLCLSQRTAYPAIQIGDTAGQAYYQVYIHDCNIEGQTGTFGVTTGPTANAAGSQADAVNLVVENCLFRGFTTAAIYANGTRDQYTKNTIYVETDGIGIDVELGGGDRGYTTIADNYLTGLSSATTKGIYFGVAPTAGLLILKGNYLCGTWNVTITDVGGGCMNYVTDASGGALINC